MVLHSYYLLTTLLLFISGLSMLRWRKWWIKGWDGQRAQIAAITSFMAVASLFLLDFDQIYHYLIAFLLMASTVYHTSLIYMFTPLHPVELESTEDKTHMMRILSANVRQKNRQSERLIRLVQEVQPQVILLTETDQRWIDELKDLEKEYPYRLLHPQSNTYGMALYSRFKLIDPKVKFLVQDDIPSIHTAIKGPAGQEIQFIGLHPVPPAPWTHEPNKDEELILAAAMTNYDDRPTIVSGDLNDVGWSEPTKQFKVISGLKDPRVGRGFFNTYNAFIPLFRMPIDHFFVSDHFRLIKIRRLSKIGSDHFPVMVELNLDVPQNQQNSSL